MSELIRLDGVSHTFRAKTEPVLALQDVSLQLCAGEMVALMGPSGSGKSTALMVAGLMLTPTSGKLFVEGQPAPDSERERAQLRNSFFGFVHQEFAVIEDLSVWANVAIPLEYATPKVSRQQRQQRAKLALKEYALPENTHRRKVSELSVGQRQRVAIARATVNSPRVILADEPTAALDTASASMVMDLFDAARQDANAVLIATHDPRVAERCDRTINLRDGCACNRGALAAMNSLSGCG